MSAPLLAEVGGVIVVEVIEKRPALPAGTVNETPPRLTRAPAGAEALEPSPMQLAPEQACPAQAPAPSQASPMVVATPSIQAVPAAAVAQFTRLAQCPLASGARPSQHSTVPSKGAPAG